MSDLIEEKVRQLISIIYEIMTDDIEMFVKDGLPIGQQTKMEFLRDNLVSRIPDWIKYIIEGEQEI